MIKLHDNRKTKVKQGLEFVLSHFAKTQSPLFPRLITTHELDYVSTLAYDMDEILRYFEESNFINCYVNGYPYKGPFNSQALIPNFIPIDLDLADFPSVKQLELSLTITLENIKIY